MDISQIAQRYELVKWTLDERLRRIIAADEADVIGHGGITIVSKATGVSRRAIHVGLKEIESQKSEQALPTSRISRPGLAEKNYRD